MKKSSTFKGQEAEKRARNYLVKQNYQITEANWRCRAGEIDIIARDTDGYLSFIEVKYRSSDSHGTPAEAITDNKKDRLVKLARIYISHNPEKADSDMRFDVVEVTPTEVKLIKNAFSA